MLGFFSLVVKDTAEIKFIELYMAFIFSIKDCGIFFVQLGPIPMMASNEI